MSIYDEPAYRKIRDFFHEPDYMHSCAFGLPFYLKRNWAKTWCGYVGIPPTHPHFGMNYSNTVKYTRWRELPIGGKSPISLFLGSIEKEDDQVSLDILYDCPGGISWANDHAAGERPDGYWYFGFDCNHYNDYSPKRAMEELVEPWDFGDRHYRNIAYAIKGVTHLANQLSDFTSAYPEVL